MTSVRFVSRPTVGELARFAVDYAFGSAAAQLIHGFSWGVVVLSLLVRMPVDLWLPPAVIGIVFGSGLIAAPFLWWSFRTGTDRLVETVQADANGIVIEAPGSEVRQAWSIYREARETGGVIMLTAAARTMSQVFSKRGVPEADVEAFRRYLRGAGLLRERAPGWRGVAGFAVGVVLAFAIPFAIGAVSVG